MAGEGEPTWALSKTMSLRLCTKDWQDGMRVAGHWKGDVHNQDLLLHGVVDETQAQGVPCRNCEATVVNAQSLTPHSEATPMAH